MKNPIQPVYKDSKGIVRFKENAIVQYLLKNSGIGLNTIAALDVSQTDKEQFDQLTGWSLSGFGDISSTSDETYGAAWLMYETGVTGEQAELQYYKTKLREVQEKMANAIGCLYGMAPEDLLERIGEL